MTDLNPDTDAKLEALLKLQEGLRLKMYKDIKGNWSIGWGRNLSANGIRQDEAQLMFENDVNDAEDQIQKSWTYYNQLDDIRKAVIIDLVFNLGDHDFMEFKATMAACEARNYSLAGQHLLDSRAAKQLPQRYQRLAYILETGNF